MTDDNKQTGDHLSSRVDAAEKELAAIKRGVWGRESAVTTSSSIVDQLARVERDIRDVRETNVEPIMISGGDSRPAELMPGLDSGSLPVTLAVTAGTAALTGDATTQCRFEYDVEDALTGEKYAGTGTDPAVAAADPLVTPHFWARPTVGYMIAATKGTAHFGTDGAMVLDWINEIPEQEACDGGGTLDQGTWD